MPISKTWPGGATNPTPTTYQIPLNTELNWTTLSAFLQAIADSAQCTSFQKFAARNATASPITVSAITDCVVISNLAVAGAVTVNLPAGADKQVFIIVDGKGDAGTNNITINRAGGDTIRGATSLVIDRNYGAVLVIYNAATTDWKVFGPFLTPGSVGPSDFTGILPTAKGGTGVNGTATYPTSGTVATVPSAGVVKSDGTALSASNVNLTSEVTGTLPVANGGTGITSLGAGVATFLGTPSSANLAAAVTDETGTGALVFANSPTLVTPALGTPSSGTLTNATGLPIDGGTTGTLPVSRGGTGITSFGTGVATALGQNVTGSGGMVLATGGTVNNPLVSNYIDLTEVATPATPASGILRVYPKSDNKLYVKDDLGVETQVGSSGSGEINAITSGSQDATGWTNGTSHTGTTDTLNSPLAPVVGTSLAVTSSAAVTLGSQTSTSGEYKTITMPSGLLNRKLKVEFYFTTPASSAGTWAVAVYQGTTKLALSTDSSGDTILPSSYTGKFTAYLDTSSATSYSVNLVQRTRASANTLYLTNIIVGPGIQPQGAALQSQTVAITGSWVSNTTYEATETRTGEWAEYYVRVLLSGAPTATNLTLTLPTDRTINTSVLQTTAESGNRIPFSVVGINDTGVAGYQGMVMYNSSTVVQPRVLDASATYTGSAAISNVQPHTFGAGDFITISFKVPIAEWAGSGTVQLAQNDVEYAFNTSGITAAGATDTTSFGYGPQGAAVGSINSTTGASSTTNFRVQFQTPIQSGDKIVLEFQEGGGTAPWFEAEARLPLVRQGVFNYGAQVIPINSTQVEVLFGNGGSASTNTTYASAGTTWASFTNLRWRVRKSSAGAAVGFGIVQPGVSSGLVSASGLPGRTDGVTITAPNVGYLIANENDVGPTAAVSSSTAFNIGTIVLTAGVWIVYGQGTFLPGTVTGNTFVTFDINTVSATFRNSASGTRYGNLPTTSGLNMAFACLPLTVNSSGSTTIYAVGSYNFSSLGTSVMRGSLTAVRIA